MGDILYNNCMSVTIDKYQSEFKDAADQDIGSILEEISKLADVVSSNSEPDCIKTENLSRNAAKKDKSVEELLEEAEELIRKNTCCTSQKVLKSDKLVLGCNIIANERSDTISQFDPEIFERIEEEVRRESEKNRQSAAIEKSKIFHHQKEKLSTWFKNEMILDKNNFKKELTDVDKNFFDDVLRKYMGDVKDVISNNSWFPQEESSQSLQPLESFEGNLNDSSSSICTLNCISKLPDDQETFVRCNLEKRNSQTHNFCAKKMVENLDIENQLTESRNDNDVCKSEEFQGETINHSFVGQKHVKNSSRHTSSVSDLNVNFLTLANYGQSNTKKDLSLENNRYTLNLTPRLELFSDSISKLMAEKLSENSKIPKQGVIDEKRKLLISSSRKAGNINSFDNKESENSESCEQISESVMNLEFLSVSKNASKLSIARLKTDYQRKKSFARKKIVCQSNLNLISKVKLALKFRKDILKSGTISKTKYNFFLNNYLQFIWAGWYHKEEGKTCRMKKLLDIREQFYKRQIKKMRSSFEDKLFLLNKQNITLIAEIDDLIKQKRSQLKDDKKSTHEEVKNLQEKIMPVELDEMQATISKLYLALSELKQQNLDLFSRNEDTDQQNSLLTDELKMFKKQIKEKNSFIAERLQEMTVTELKLRKKIEDLKVDMNTKEKSLKVTKLNCEKLEQTVLSLENELDQLRVKEANLYESLGEIKNQAQREKQLSQKLKNQVILDSTKIMDLTRQVIEMERIIKRRNPDSVSALILTANSDQDGLLLEKIKLLEERNQTLENEIQVTEKAGQQRLADFQKEFAEMMHKNNMEIAELEKKLSEVSMKEKRKYIHISTQTLFENDKSEEQEKPSSIQNDDKRDSANLSKMDRLKLQDKKNDIQLIASICRLKLELSNKNKALSKVSKEFQDLQKTNRRLQKEREKQLNDRRAVFKNLDTNTKNNHSLFPLENTSFDSKSSDVNYHNSNASSTEHLSSLQKCSLSKGKPYDPLQYSEHSETKNMTKNLVIENSVLKEELSKMKKDFMSLKSKRLDDLNLLQEEHERELSALIKKYSVQVDDMNVQT